MMKIIKKILYYKDIGLFWKIFITSLKISFWYLIKKSQPPIFSKSLQKRPLIKNADKEKITRYVNLYTFMRSKLGIRETCLTYSLLLGNMLRQAGIDTKVNFGIRKKDGEIKGHCWLTVNNIEIPTIYEPIFEIPKR